MHATFKRIVWNYYKKHGRHDLPWRKTKDPYKILVSEVMLQQTQVSRVEPFYKNFLEKFPTAKALADAPLSDVLKAWQGLGYNRRAKLLQQTAKAVVTRGGFPKSASELVALPGIGPYTASALAAFAFNQDAVCVETNIRTAVIHHFFPNKRKITDTQITKILEKNVQIGKGREWNLALMDYGAYLKQSGVKLNTKSKHYNKQSTFRGSNREARGAILKELAKGSQIKKRLLGLLGDDRTSQLELALVALEKEGMVQKKGSMHLL